MISVIIPIYNTGQQLRRILECLRKQTEKNFEVLLVDDGSKDDSRDICREVTEVDKRFRYIYQENGGVSSARNKGLREAKGQYITFLDADDGMDENYLAVLLDALERSNADAAVCDVAVVKAGAETRRFTCPDAVWSRTEALNHLFERKIMNSGPCAKLFKREILEGLLFPPLKAYEDILFVKDAFCKCQTVAVTDKTAYYYIQNESGAMSSFHKAPTTDIIVAADLMLEFICAEKALSADCFYTTASHLMQYVQPLLEKREEQNGTFIRQSKELYKKYFWNIMCCKAFPWKEKIAYGLFVLGWDIWHKRRIFR